jgi:hypothetical protein
VTSCDTEPPPAQPHPVVRLRVWREAIYIVAFYAAYTVVRDVHGTRPVSRAHAFANAEKIIHIERFFGLFQERRIQSWVLPNHLLIRSLDDFYGTAHFVITLAALVFVFRWQPWRYPLWRNTLAITTALALIGFAFFPLMPPRLLPASYHIVDTLHAIGGLWSFDSGPMNAVSNQYAAMPSLHFAWALWCALALAPAVKRRPLKVLIWCYPVLTLVCILATGNHYLLDAIAGALTLAGGYAGARLLATVLAGRQNAGGAEDATAT